MAVPLIARPLGRGDGGAGRPDRLGAADLGGVAARAAGAWSWPLLAVPDQPAAAAADRSCAGRAASSAPRCCGSSPRRCRSTASASCSPACCRRTAASSRPPLAPLLSSLVVIAAYLVYGALASGQRRRPGRAAGRCHPGAVGGHHARRRGAQPAARWSRCARRGPAAAHLALPRRAGPPGGASLARGRSARAARPAGRGHGRGLAGQRTAAATGTLNVYQYVQAVYLLPYAVLAVPVATSAFPALATGRDTSAVVDASDGARVGGTGRTSRRAPAAGRAARAAARWPGRPGWCRSPWVSGRRCSSRRPCRWCVLRPLDAGRTHAGGAEALARCRPAWSRSRPGWSASAWSPCSTRALYVRGRPAHAGRWVAAGWLVAGAGAAAGAGRRARTAAPRCVALGVGSSAGHDPRRRRPARLGRGRRWGARPRPGPAPLRWPSPCVGRRRWPAAPAGCSPQRLPTTLPGRVGARRRARRRRSPPASTRRRCSPARPRTPAGCCAARLTAGTRMSGAGPAGARPQHRRRRHARRRSWPRACARRGADVVVADPAGTAEPVRLGRRAPVRGRTDRRAAAGRAPTCWRLRRLAGRRRRRARARPRRPGCWPPCCRGPPRRPGRRRHPAQRGARPAPGSGRGDAAGRSGSSPGGADLVPARVRDLVEQAARARRAPTAARARALARSPRLLAPARSTPTAGSGCGAPARPGRGRPPLVLTVSRLAPQKDLPMLVDALAAAAPGAAPTWVVVGAPATAPLQARLAGPDRRRRGAPVRLLGRRDDVADLLRAADVVRAAERAGRGRRWSSRRRWRPACRSSPPTPAALRDVVGDAALLVPPGDPAALARPRSTRCCSTRTARATLAAAARRAAAALPDGAATPRRSGRRRSRRRGRRAGRPLARGPPAMT